MLWPASTSEHVVPVNASATYLAYYHPNLLLSLLYQVRLHPCEFQAPSFHFPRQEITLPLLIHEC